MQYPSETRANTITMRLTSGLAEVLEMLTARYNHHRVYRDTLAELRTLSDRDLTDLGLSSARLTAIARNAADAKVKLK
jgi:uncharacterized protein YjiS (DUF1127 family)